MRHPLGVLHHPHLVAGRHLDAHLGQRHLRVSQQPPLEVLVLPRPGHHPPVELGLLIPLCHRPLSFPSSPPAVGSHGPLTRSSIARDGSVTSDRRRQN